MKITSFTVLPDTPERLRHLNELAYNLYFSWNMDVQELFRSLDPETWEAARRNPARMLCLTPQEKLDQAAKDPDFLDHLEAVYAQFQRYLREPTWWERQFGRPTGPQLAYFCAEFGLHECLPVFSGGLGVLAGDHIKSASDLGLPLVGVGLLYRQGYFRQYLNAEGMQQEHFPENDWYSMPVHLEKDPQGAPLKNYLDTPNGRLWFQVWRAAVGRVCIYLMDTNIEDNPQQFRDITKVLYDPDRVTRVWQEILLGIGGVRALRSLGHNPLVYHANEGHSAFLLLERIRLLMAEHQLSYDEARTLVWSTSVFTTHTPVPAGNERFDRGLLEPFFSHYVKELGVSWEHFLADGRENRHDHDEAYCLTVLALRYAAFANGVSRLHGEVSRKMWRNLFPGIPENEIPIAHVTNGVHVRSWLALPMLHLFQRHQGAEAPSEVADSGLWKNVDAIPDKELWQAHEQRRRHLVEFVRARVTAQLQRRGARAGELSRVCEILDPRVLTIGFARRFATYKRGYLFLMKPERLKQILCDPHRPVQMIFAGKAHSADNAAKDIIRQICELANQPELRNRLVFLEDYDLDVARNLVQGCDVWLNNPRRPLEASGTSGMKAALNGCVNFSVLDGWWDEAYTTEVGWALGQGETFENHDLQDRVESDLLYGGLEREIVPLFYDRDETGVPRGWTKIMKKSISRLSAGFNSHRMLKNYTHQFYMRALRLHERLTANDHAETRALTAWFGRLRQEWHQVQIVKMESPVSDFLYKGTEVEVRAWVRLNAMKPEDIIVECYHGPLDASFNITSPKRERMQAERLEGDLTVFHTKFQCSRGGHYGHTVRILPGHENLAVEFLPGFMKWVE